MLAGGVIAYPTEAVFGLGCLPENRAAVERVLAIKRRSWRKGLLLIGSDLAQLERFVVLPSGRRRKDVIASWPGPVTWVLPATRHAPSWISGGRDSVAVRLTDHPLARELCAAVGQALVSTSANVSRRPPLRDLRKTTAIKRGWRRSGSKWPNRPCAVFSWLLHRPVGDSCDGRCGFSEITPA